VAESYVRPTRAEIDVEAFAANVSLLRRISHPAAVCAVVKADAYGHRARLLAGAALEAGAAGLAVALVEEGVELREAGIAGPILLLAEPLPDAAEAVFEHRLTPTLYSRSGLVALERAAARVGHKGSVHVKVDTGMHRVGLEPAEVIDFVLALETAGLDLEGFWTHLAVADSAKAEDHSFTDLQLERFAGHLRELEAAGVRPSVRHAANSGGAIAHPRARLDMVRPGIALYGELPSPALAPALEAAAPGAALAPVLSFVSRVVAVRRLDAGERPSYGRLRPLPVSSEVATVPVGYADGVPRRLFEAGADVLIGGRRRPIAGAVTMDQLMVDCGPAGDVSVGDEVVLIGGQGDERIGASEWARLLGTISYEVLTGIGARVPRVARGGAVAQATGWRRWLGAATGPVPSPP
jgi:alanine racemase